MPTRHTTNSSKVNPHTLTIRSRLISPGQISRSAEPMPISTVTTRIGKRLITSTMPMRTRHTINSSKVNPQTLTIGWRLISPGQISKIMDMTPRYTVQSYGSEKGCSPPACNHGSNRATHENWEDSYTHIPTNKKLGNRTQRRIIRPNFTNIALLSPRIGDNLAPRNP
jgi:hypothetical protein